ncbi:MAG: phage tail tube protein [Bryobacteraceae bacterium]|jgi:hypothetical protein
MAYTSTQAQSGNGIILAINTGTLSSAIWTTIGEITDLAQSGKTNKSDDATNLQSSAEEFIPTILTPGSWGVTLNRISGDAGQAAVLASFNALPPTIKQYRITLPKAAGQSTSGDAFAFSAMTEEFNDLGTVKADKKISTLAKLKVSGPVVLTVGS